MRYESTWSPFMNCEYTFCNKTRDISNYSLGRCFEIEIERRNETISFIWIDIKKTLSMFINLPHIFLNGIHKSMIQVNTGENVSMKSFKLISMITAESIPRHMIKAMMHADLKLWQKILTML